MLITPLSVNNKFKGPVFFSEWSEEAEETNFEATNSTFIDPQIVDRGDATIV